MIAIATLLQMHLSCLKVFKIQKDALAPAVGAPLFYMEEFS